MPDSPTFPESLSAPRSGGFSGRANGAYLFLAASALAMLVFGWVIYRFALPPSNFIPVGGTADFPSSEKPYELVAVTRFFLVNTGQEWIALSQRPPHARFRNCFFRWDEQRAEFVEGCGGSRFALDGSYIGGPSPREMDQHPLKIEDGQIWVDTTREIPGARLDDPWWVRP